MAFLMGRIVPDIANVTLTFGTTGVDVTPFVVSGDISRGRTRENDENNVGTAEIVLENDSRDFDPPGFVASSGAYGDIRRGQPVVVKFDSTTIYAGNVADWNHEWPVDDTPTASMIVEDALGRLGRQKAMAAWQPIRQRAGARLTAALARPEVDWSASTDFDKGCMMLGRAPVTDGTNALSYCQQVARSDGGRFFASRTNELSFRQLNQASLASVAATFRDDETQIPFWEISVRYGSEEWYTEVVGQRFGGQRLSVVASSTITDQHGGGTIPLDRTGLLTGDDAAVYNLIEYLLSVYEDPAPAIDGLSIDMMNLPDSQADAVAGLDLGDRVQVVWTPTASGDQVTQTLAVEGIRDRFDRAHWRRELSLSAFIGIQGFVLDDDTLGELDTSTLGV